MKNCEGKIETVQQPNVKNQVEVKNREKNAQFPTKQVNIINFRYFLRYYVKSFFSYFTRPSIVTPAKLLSRKKFKWRITKKLKDISETICGNIFVTILAKKMVLLNLILLNFSKFWLMSTRPEIWRIFPLNTTKILNVFSWKISPTFLVNTLCLDIRMVNKDYESVKNIWKKRLYSDLVGSLYHSVEITEIFYLSDFIWNESWQI